MRKKYADLQEWRSPFLRPFSFACVAEPGVSSTLTAAELGSLVRKLPAIVSAPFFEPASVVNTWPFPPVESDFAAAEEYELAYEAFSPKFHEPKPWLGIEVKSTQIQTLVQDMLSWSINNKAYKITIASGDTHTAAFSRAQAEEDQIATQESQHQNLVEEFVASASRLFESLPFCMSYSSNHLFDNTDERADVCYFDRVTVFANEEHRLLIWAGHIRWYG